MIAPNTLDPGLLLSARVLILLIFTRALRTKFRHYEEFVGVVGAYRLLPDPLVRATALIVLGLENLIALSFLTGYALASVAWMAAGLLCLFAVGMGINLARGRRQIDCGCFRGNLRQRISGVLIVRNVVLAGVALLPEWSEVTEASGLQVLTGVGAGTTLFLLWLAGEQLAAVRQQAALFIKRRS